MKLSSLSKHMMRLVFTSGSNPLQCSCLEDPRDGAAWWAAVYGVKNMEDIKKSQIEVLEKKMTSNDKNYILAGINNRLDIEEETITKLEGINNGNNSN